MDALTVMTRTSDPYRLDTPVNRRAGEWFAAIVARFLPDASLAIHLRGLHYLASSSGVVLKIDGSPYRNTEEDWEFFSTVAGKAARWLGLVPWNRIRDERNQAPRIFVPGYRPSPGFHLAPYTSPPPALAFDLPAITADALPSLRRLMPRPTAYGGGAQRWRVSLWAEKSSLADMLEAIARDVNGEVVLPTGDASDTLIAECMARASEDGRGLAIVYCSDFDPSGFAMPRTVARKMMALRDQIPAFAGVPVTLVRAAMTKEQAEAWGLPSTPLKDEELRADEWRARWGREQTEIDAALALAPDRLDAAIRAEVARFHDATLAQRVREAAWQWEALAAVWRDALPIWPSHVAEIEAARAAAQEATDRLAAALAALAPEVQAAADARERLKEAQQAASNALAAAMAEAIEAGDLAAPETPEPDLSEGDAPPLYDSDQPWEDATQRLIRDRDGDAVRRGRKW